MMNSQSVWRGHPVVKGMAYGGAFFIVAAMVVNVIPPAWALSIPVGNIFVLDLGDLPPWIASLVALAVYWKARKAERAAVAIKTDLGKVQDDVKLIERNTNSLTKQIEANALLAGERIGKDKQKIIAAESAEKLAEGQRHGIEMERASVAAKATAPNNAASPAAAAKQPLPVADDRTAGAAERVAEATERVASATEVKLTDGKK